MTRDGRWAVLLALLPSAAVAQVERFPLLVAPAAEGVVLRWVWPADGLRPLGYHVERREPGGAWNRITAQPVARVRRRDAARSLLGTAFGRYESLLFPADPLEELADPESHRSLLLLAADVEPGVARALGLRFDDASARRGLTYEYRLIAVMAVGEREVARGGPAVAGSYREADPPDSLEADQPREGVALRWSSAGAFTAYHIFRRRNREPWAQLSTAPVVVFSADGPTATQAPWFFRDATAAIGDTLGYAVVGIDPFGRTSRRSREARLVVRDVAPPARPLQAAAHAIGDTVLVTWLRPPDPTVVSYRVWRAADRDGPFEPITAPLPATATAARDVGPAASRLWWYRVTAADAAGNESDPSFVAAAEVRDVIPPAAPTGLTAVADTHRIVLTWRPVDAPDLRGYRVYRASTHGGEFGLLTARPVTGPAYADTIRRGADQAFHYRVTAVDSAFNESAPSPTLAARPPDMRPPSAPRIEWVRPCESCLMVGWFRNPEPDVAFYRVRYRPRGDSLWVDLPDSTTATVDTIVSVEPRRLYEISVVATDDAGNRSASARPVTGEAYRRTAPPAPALTRVAYDREGHGVILEWGERATPGLRVQVLRRTPSGTGVRVLGTIDADTGRFVDVAITAGERYEYTLRSLAPYGALGEPHAWRRIAIPRLRR